MKDRENCTKRGKTEEEDGLLSDASLSSEGEGGLTVLKDNQEAMKVREQALTRS